MSGAYEEQPEAGEIMLEEQSDDHSYQQTNGQSIDQSDEQLQQQDEQSINQSEYQSNNQSSSQSDQQSKIRRENQTGDQFDEQSIETMTLDQPLEATINSSQYDQSNNQFVDQSINQSTNQFVEPSSQAFHQTAEFMPMMNETINQPIDLSIDQSNEQFDEPDADSISLNQSNNQTNYDLSVDLNDTMPANYQSNAQASYRSNNQSARQSSRQADLEQTIEQTIDQLISQQSNSQSNNQSNNQSLDIPELAPLPSFASDDVRQLDRLIQSKRAKLQSTVEKIGQFEQRINVMSAHLVHVQREYEHTINHSNQQTQAINQSKHLSQVSERSLGKLQQQMRDIKRNIASTNGTIQSLQKQRVSLADTVAAFQAKASMSNEALIQWHLAAKQKEEERQMIEAYTNEDSKLLNDRRNAYQKLRAATTEKQVELQATRTNSNELAIEQQSAQFELGKAHMEKMKLIDSWDKAVQMTHEKDTHIIKVSEEILDVREQTEEQKSKNNELNNFLSIEQTNNKKLIASIDDLERRNSKQRDLFKNQKEAIISLEDSVLNKRAVLEKLESELRASKQLNQSQNQKRDQSIKRRDAAKKMLAARAAELEQEEEALKSVKNQNAHLTEKLALAQEEEAKITKKVTQSKNALFNLNEKLSKERTRESQLIASISNAVNTSKMLQNKIRQLDQRSLKQQETLYQIEYLIQNLERKRAVESGVKSEEENELLNIELRELEAKYEVEVKEMKLIKQSIARVNDEHRLIVRNQEKLKAARASLSNATSELMVRIGAMEREFQSTSAEFNALNVSHDRTKLELNAVSARLYDAQGELQKAELTAIELDLSMKQRLQVIQQHMDIKNMEFRQSSQMRQMQSNELTERKRALKLLETKYRAIRAKFVGSDGLTSIDEDDEFKDARQSQGYYIVQAGLKREELCIEREKLRAELTNLEQQIEGVTRVTLEMQSMNQSNQNNQKDNSNLAELNAQLVDVQSKAAAIDAQLASARTRQSHTSRELEQSKHVLAQLINEVAQSTSQVRNCEKKATDLDKSQSNAIAALKRARNQSNKRANETQAAMVEAFTNVLNEGRRDRLEEEKIETSSRSKKSSTPSQQPNPQAEQLAKEEMELIMTQLRVAETRRRNAVWKELLVQYADDHSDVGATLADLCRAANVKLEWADTRPSSSVSSIVSADMTPLTGRSQLSTASSTSSNQASTFNVSFPPINPHSRPGSNSVSGRSTGRVSAR